MLAPSTHPTHCPPTLASGDAALVAAAVRHVAAQTQLDLSGAAFKRFIEVHYTVRARLPLAVSGSVLCVCAVRSDAEHDVGWRSSPGSQQINQLPINIITSINPVACPLPPGAAPGPQ